MRTTHFCILCLIAAMSFLAIPTARAAYTIDITQVGSNVVATGAGSIDTTGLTQSVPGISPGSTTIPNAAFIVVGPTTTTNLTEYTSPTGPASFGSGAFSDPASSGSGQLVGITGKNSILELPVGYTSGSDLGTSTDTWNNKTITSMALTSGTYTYTWGTGQHADSFTIHIATVPEPATVSLLALTGAAMLRRCP